MSWLVELLLTFSRPIGIFILELFGYDRDWEPIRSNTKRRSPILSGVLCFTILAVFGGGLIWLAWLVSR
jgi:hypothetical protein